MKLHILGTGHATVKENYNTCFVIENEKDYFLIDGGGGKQILKNLEEARIDVHKINHAFITHNHTDHIFGMIWVLRVVFYGYAIGEHTADFHLYGSEVCLNAIETIFKITCGEKLWNKFAGNKVFFHKIQNGSKEKIIGLDFEFFDTFAKDMPQMAFSVNGNNFVFCGDVPLDEGYYDKFKNANYLWFEAFCLEKDRNKNVLPLQKHKTIEEACEVAKIIRPRHLILSHTDDDFDGNRKKTFLQAAHKVYDDDVLFPNDLETIEIIEIDEVKI